MEPLSNPVDALFAALIDKLEEDPGFEVQGFLEQHAEQAIALKARLDRLRRVGLVGDARGESTLLESMRERFGVHSKMLSLVLRPEKNSSVEDFLPSRVAGGRYRVLSEIGRGGMGQVFRALDLDLGREVAIKVVKIDQLLPGVDAARQRDRVERFLREAQVTAQLEHPSIVPVHDIGVDKTGQLYYTMKLVEGQTLEGKIREWHAALSAGKSFPTPELLRIVIQVCNALAFAHERGVVHRDLKPSNVMVGRFGEVQVMDWGLAKLVGSNDSERLAHPAPLARSQPGSNTLVGEVLGTPTHMAPEQARGALTIDHHADVFGIGAILYHGLIGVPPNQHFSQSGEPAHLQFSGKVSPELEAICHRALMSDPALRYESAERLAEDLRAYLNQRVVTAYETGAWAELRKWTSRNRAFAAAVASGLLTLLAGLVAFSILKSEAVARGNKVLQLSSLQNLEDLVEDASQLWPPYPENVKPYEDWVRRANELLAELPEHEKQLMDLRAKALPLAGRQNRHLASHSISGGKEAEVANEPIWTFADNQDRWWHSSLERLVAELRDFCDPETGVFSFGTSPGNGWGVMKRLEFARTIRELSLEGLQASPRWRDAIASISDPLQCPMYNGLEIAPQLGLLPIGQDPRSGLWEFAHMQTGEPAERGVDGKLVLKEETGLVLVLLPGGTFYMGAQNEDASGQNYDADARPNEAPVRALDVGAFFFAKYEVTQGQWVRATGLNPCVTPAGQHSEDGHLVNLLHPVESVCWTDCCALLERLRLTLPTESQWEYGARGGTTTAWWTGSGVCSLQGAANLMDVSFAKMEAKRTATPCLDDGYADVHAPIGTFAANPFGLHDVLGNVQEWCLDVMKSYRDVGRPEAANEKTAAVAGHVVKGGGFFSDAMYLRCAYRDQLSAVNRNGGMGLRPARAIDSSLR